MSTEVATPEVPLTPEALEVADPVATAKALTFEHEWTWYAHCTAQRYADSCVELGRIASVYDFWCHFNHIPDVHHFFTSIVRCRGNPIYGYAFFRDGIKPEWEDPVNARGGEFVMRVCTHEPKVAELWQALLLACTSNHAPLVGVRCIAKMPMKFEAWYADVETEAVREWLEPLLADSGVRIVSHKLHAAMQPQ